MRASASGTNGIVVGVLDTPAGREAVRQGALRAARDGAVLHLVAAYDARDNRSHRGYRAIGPRDIVHLMSPRADAEILVRQAACEISDIGVITREHVHDGSLRAGVRKISRTLTTASPRPLRTPAPARAWVRFSESV